MSKSKTVHTQYGETTVEVVECDSCGNTVAKDSASRFAMNEGVPNPRFNEADRQGYACEHCVSEGPLSFPERTKERVKILARDGDLILGVMMWPLISIMMVSDANEDWQRGYVLASIGAWVWIIISAAIVGAMLIL